jgi:hypothetical protein
VPVSLDQPAVGEEPVGHGDPEATGEVVVATPGLTEGRAPVVAAQGGDAFLLRQPRQGFDRLGDVGPIQAG